MVVDRTALEGNPKAAREWQLFHEQVFNLAQSRLDGIESRVGVGRNLKCSGVWMTRRQTVVSWGDPRLLLRSEHCLLNVHYDRGLIFVLNQSPRSPCSGPTKGPPQTPAHSGTGCCKVPTPKM
jgi:hypothetical protein